MGNPNRNELQPPASRRQAAGAGNQFRRPFFGAEPRHDATSSRNRFHPKVETIRCNTQEKTGAANAPTAQMGGMAATTWRAAGTKGLRKLSTETAGE